MTATALLYYSDKDVLNSLDGEHLIFEADLVRFQSGISSCMHVLVYRINDPDLIEIPQTYAAAQVSAETMMALLSNQTDVLSVFEKGQVFLLENLSPDNDEIGITLVDIADIAHCLPAKGTFLTSEADAQKRSA